MVPVIFGVAVLLGRATVSAAVQVEVVSGLSSPRTKDGTSGCKGFLRQPKRCRSNASICWPPGLWDMASGLRDDQAAPAGHISWGEGHWAEGAVGSTQLF